MCVIGSVSCFGYLLRPGPGPHFREWSPTLLEFMINAKLELRRRACMLVERVAVERFGLASLEAEGPRGPTSAIV